MPQSPCNTVRQGSFFLEGFHWLQFYRGIQFLNHISKLICFIFKKPYQYHTITTECMYSEYLQQCFAPWLLFHLKNSVSISRDNFTWHKGAGIKLHLWNAYERFFTYPSVLLLSNRRLCTGDPGAELLVGLAGGSVCPCSRETLPGLPGSL